MLHKIQVGLISWFWAHELIGQSQENINTRVWMRTEKHYPRNKTEVKLIAWGRGRGA